MQRRRHPQARNTAKQRSPRLFRGALASPPLSHAGALPRRAFVGGFGGCFTSQLLRRFALPAALGAPGGAIFVFFAFADAARDDPMRPVPRVLVVGMLLRGERRQRLSLRKGGGGRPAGRGAEHSPRRDLCSLRRRLARLLFPPPLAFFAAPFGPREAASRVGKAGKNGEAAEAFRPPDAAREAAAEPLLLCRGEATSAAGGGEGKGEGEAEEAALRRGEASSRRTTGSLLSALHARGSRRKSDTGGSGSTPNAAAAACSAAAWANAGGAGDWAAQAKGLSDVGSGEAGGARTLRGSRGLAGARNCGGDGAPASGWYAAEKEFV
ncbi:hypothetical protein BESB_080510 [Besnoitia besnoiti]|uniref:Uncharacterized protein n=1 Tax=Besnoitia besnoiti TaxID=94643 RepID=A0A2A9M769_BESBE|nr:hypothetical protein BESB_080510 [Besnoitia besnoiti]PFH33835.1 hypothetical protein BESB_080510 [Besnoitia besnoiti]